MTNPDAQPIIDHVPGMEPLDKSQLPNRDVVPIAPGDVTPQMMNHAIGSPYNQLADGMLELPAPVEDVSQKALEGAGVQMDINAIDAVEAATVRPMSAQEPRDGRAYQAGPPSDAQKL